jgi:hypothetical protein
MKNFVFVEKQKTKKGKCWIVGEQKREWIPTSYFSWPVHTCTLPSPRVSHRHAPTQEEAHAHASVVCLFMVRLAVTAAVALACCLLRHDQPALVAASAPPSLPVIPLVDGAALAPPNADGVRQWIGKKTVLSWSPRAFHLAAFLTATERAHFVSLAAPKMTSSYVLDPVSSQLVPSESRTSRGAWIDLGATDTVLGVERRLELLLDLPMVYQEATQVLAYGTGKRKTKK